MATARNANGPAGIRQHEPEYFVIGRDDMVKGADVMRANKRVRQFAVMVGGSIRVVTSGDTVDRATYDALIEAGAIQPAPTPEQDSEAQVEATQEGE